MGLTQDDDTVLVEYDIRYKREDWLALKQKLAFIYLIYVKYFRSSLFLPSATRPGRSARLTTAFTLAGLTTQFRSPSEKTSVRFTNSEIWINIMHSFRVFMSGSDDQREVMLAIDEWMRFTCLNFVQRTDEANYVAFENGEGWVRHRSGQMLSTLVFTRKQTELSAVPQVLEWVVANRKWLWHPIVARFSSYILLLHFTEVLLLYIHVLVHVFIDFGICLLISVNLGIFVQWLFLLLQIWLV